MWIGWRQSRRVSVDIEKWQSYERRSKIDRTLSRWEPNLVPTKIRRRGNRQKDETVQLSKGNAHRLQKHVCVPCFEGLLEGGPTSVSSMDAGLHAYCVVVSRRQLTYFAQKWVITHFYKALHHRTTALNICLEVFNRAVFLGLLKFHHNAVLGDINEAKVRRS